MEKGTEKRKGKLKKQQLVVLFLWRIIDFFVLLQFFCMLLRCCECCCFDVWFYVIRHVIITNLSMFGDALRNFEFVQLGSGNCFRRSPYRCTYNSDTVSGFRNISETFPVFGTKHFRTEIVTTPKHLNHHPTRTFKVSHFRVMSAQ